MATTTNYGWTTPNDTDLVKDGASAIRTLGQSIDTTFAELKGGTSGQMLTKASNTDLDLVWVTPQIGDITSITATTPLTGGGTTGDVTVGIQAGSTSQSGALQLTDSTSSTSTTTAATPNSVKTSYDLADAAIAKSTVTTAGDIIYRNATVPTRLGIGTAGQVLKVNSGATAPEWATVSSSGALTKISTQTFTSSAAVNVNSVFTSTYTNYLILAEITNSTSNVDSYFKLRVSGVDSSTSYSLFGWLSQGSSVSAENWTTSYPIIRAGSTTRSVGQITVMNPFSASPTGFIGGSGGSHGYAAGLNGRHTASTSYDGFSLTCGSGNITGTVTIYGYEA